MRKFFVVATILVSLLTPLTSSIQVAAQKTDPESVIRGIWEDALNAKDLDKALTLVTDDARLVLIPAPRGTSGIFNGKTELRGWWEEFAVTRNGYVEFGVVARKVNRDRTEFLDGFGRLGEDRERPVVGFEDRATRHRDGFFEQRSPRCRVAR